MGIANEMVERTVRPQKSFVNCQVPGLLKPQIENDHLCDQPKCQADVLALEIWSHM